MGFFDVFLYGFIARKLHMKVSQYKEFLQYQKSDNLTLETYRLYLAEYATEMSLQEFIDRQRKQIAEEEPKAVEKRLEYRNRHLIWL